MRQKRLSLLFHGVCWLLWGIILGFTTFLIQIVERQDVRMYGSMDHHLLSTSRRPDMDTAITMDWPHTFLHIINTRFQQQQPNLKALGRARLVLFETFCLNSVVRQSLLKNKADTTPPFIWIIKVDPHLSFTLLGDLIALVSPYEFVYVVGSNVNFGVGHRAGGWRGGEAGRDVLNSVIYTGNLTLLQRAHVARETRPILETRVDADDGLHVHYLEEIQRHAKKRLVWKKEQENQGRNSWMYWCPLNHVDWTPTPPEVSLETTEFGVFVPKKSPHVCITAGITSGTSLGVHEKQVPRFMHHQLVEELRYAGDGIDCGGVNKTDCLHFVTKPALGAIRSRTSTSAGMRGVLTREKDFTKRLDGAIGHNATLIKLLLLKDFHCYFDKVVEANRHLRDHLVEIVKENLVGQCTKGHSCKETTKEVLHNLLLDVNGHQSLKGRHQNGPK